ncbi:MAG: DUF4013 domain-containing protein [Methanobacteriaceae archaeon]|nr:DUF4013 domain-containing protein [Methanobacteriaceae archaeon]
MSVDESMEIIIESLKYAISDPMKLLIYLVVSILSVFILPIFLVAGYDVRIIEGTIKSSDALPEFNSWGSMFVDGIKYIMAHVVYLIIPIIITLIGMGLYNVNSFLTILLGVIALIVGFVLLLISGPAIVRMVHHDKNFGSIFDFEQILSMISNVGWVNYILFMIIFQLIFVILITISDSLMNISTIFGVLSLIIAGIQALAYSRALTLLFKNYLTF